MTDTPEIRARNRQIDLIMALDSARDALSENDDPESMFHAILRIVRGHFAADSAALWVTTDNGRDTELIVCYGVPQAAALTLCQRSLEFATPSPIPSDDWHNTLGLRIVLHDQPLGSIFLARSARPFDDEERILLEYAESQIDSAVIQARMMWKLAQRNRELEAIYQIDRLRDSHENESEMVNGFIGLLVRYFLAELALIFLSDIDSGELVLRGIIGKNNVTAAMLDTIRDLTTNLTIPQIIPSLPGASEDDDLVLLASPLIVSAVRLGSLVVGRRERFSFADQRLMHAITSQIDSAIVQSRVTAQLIQRSRELEVIYAIDAIRDREPDFDVMAQAVLNEICKAVACELGYLMLYNASAEEPLELKACTLEGVLQSPVYADVIQKTSAEALRTGDFVMSNRPDGPIRSILAMPLILNNQIIGVFGMANSDDPRGFTAEDCRMLNAITSQVDTAVFERLERRRMRKVLARSVDPKVIDRLLQRADENLIYGERVNLTVLFADLRGSAAWAERTAPEELVNTLNRFLGRMTDVVFQQGGTLDKFVGDQIVALFGTPIQMEDHAYRAVLAAIEMQKAHRDLCAELSAQGIELPPMGIGVSSGEAIAGEVGSPVRTDFTAMGTTINLGARLCAVAPANAIYISEATHAIVANLVEAVPAESTHLKGIGEMAIFSVIRVREV